VLKRGLPGGADVWDGPNGAGNFFGLPASGACLDTSTFAGASLNLVNIRPRGGCVPSDSTPTGKVTADQPTTVCCQ
jgi:hypothetical protein